MYLPTVEEMLAKVQQQEKDLQFKEFNSETALEIGLSIIERAKKENLQVAIDICINGHQLFHYAFQGTAPNNDQWILMKNRLANRYCMSSYRNKLRLQSMNKTLADIGLSSSEYAAVGGAFPITIQNVGVVGTITVSGLQDNEDHDLVVWAIEKHLSKWRA